MGVGFRGSGKVAEVHVRRTRAALGLTCVQQSLFFTHLAAFCRHYGETLSCKMGIFNGGLFACKSWQKKKEMPSTSTRPIQM